MKKYILITFAFLTIFSCSRENDDIEKSPQDCRIISAKAHNYLFDDVTISKSLSDPNFLKFSFEYDAQNRINKIIGGLLTVPPKSDFILSNDSSDEITYSGNTVSVKVSANRMIRPYDKEFKIEGGKILSQKITSKFPISNNTISANFSYVYSGNQIFEKYDGILNNRLNKTFTIENGNLKEVIKWNYDSNGNVIGKTETVFSGYDNQRNLLKGKFFINGAFYMAFSSNIYNAVDSKSYNLENGVYVQNGNYYSINYNPTLTSNYFEQKCD